MRKIEAENSNNTNLDALITSYYQNKQDLDAQQKVCDEENKLIKRGFEDLGIDKYTVNGITATKTITERVSINETRMIEVLKKRWIQQHGSEQIPFIVLKETIDEEALENYMYEHPEFTNDEDFVKEFKLCKTKTQIVTLRLKKGK